MTTYDEPGKGRKQCPKCKTYVGAPMPVCECGHVFSKVKTYDESGKGRKQCPKCETYVGAPMPLCACGHVFEKKKPAPSVTKTYDEPGKRRKQCPQCEKYVGTVTKTCACGHVFEKKQPAPSVTKTFDQPGKRRKQCPQCEKYVSVVTKNCACGHVFEKKKEFFDEPGEGRKKCENCGKYTLEKKRHCPNCKLSFKPKSEQPVLTKKEQQAQAHADAYGWASQYGYIIIAPRGECPIRLKGTDKASVHTWCQQIINRGHAEGVHYSATALKYWAARLVDYNSPDYPEIAAHIDTSAPMAWNEDEPVIESNTDEPDSEPDSEPASLGRLKDLARQLQQGGEEPIKVPK